MKKKRISRLVSANSLLLPISSYIAACSSAAFDGDQSDEPQRQWGYSLLDVDGDSKEDLIIWDQTAAGNKGQIYIYRDLNRDAVTDKISLEKLKEGNTENWIVLEGSAVDSLLNLYFEAGIFDFNSGRDFSVWYSNEGLEQEVNEAIILFHTPKDLPNNVTITLDNEASSSFYDVYPLLGSTSGSDFDLDGVVEDIFGKADSSYNNKDNVGKVTVSFSKSAKTLAVYGENAGAKLDDTRAVQVDLDYNGKIDMVMFPEVMDSIKGASTLTNTGGAVIIWDLLSMINDDSNTTTLGLSDASSYKAGITRIQGATANDNTSSELNHWRVVDLPYGNNQAYDNAIDIILFSPNHNAAAGAIYVINPSHGAGYDSQMTIDLNVASDSFIKIAGEAASGLGSNAIMEYGKIKSDGQFYDVAVSAPLAVPDPLLAGGTKQGCVYIISSFVDKLPYAGAGEFDIATVADIKIYNSKQDNASGFGGIMKSYSVNFDSYIDLVIGVKRLDNIDSDAYVVFGGPDLTSFDFSDDVANWVGKGMIIKRENALLDFNRSTNATQDLQGLVEGRGDFNADGFADTLIADKGVGYNLTMYKDSTDGIDASVLRLQGLSSHVANFKHIYSADSDRQSLQDIVIWSGSSSELHIVWGRKIAAASATTISYDFDNGAENLPEDALSVTANNSFSFSFFDNLISDIGTDAVFASPNARDGKGALYFLSDIGNLQNNSHRKINLSESSDVLEVYYSGEGVNNLAIDYSLSTYVDDNGDVQNNFLIIANGHFFNLGLDSIKSATGSLDIASLQLNEL